MKTRVLLVALAAVAFSLATSSSALAQSFYRGSSDNPNGPTVSPYLNLLQSDSFGVTNYQSLVRPLVNQGNAIRRQGGALQQLERATYSAGPRLGTGHSSYFMNYSHFFPNARR